MWRSVDFSHCAFPLFSFPVPTAFELCSLNRGILGSNSQIAGRFRTSNETALVGGVRQGVPDCYIRRELEALGHSTRHAYNGVAGSCEGEVDVIANYLFRLGTIHPFYDGNGRVIVAAGSLMLSQAFGIPFPEIIECWVTQKEFYIRAIAKDHNQPVLETLFHFFCKLLSALGRTVGKCSYPLVNRNAAWLWFDREFEVAHLAKA